VSALELRVAGRRISAAVARDAVTFISMAVFEKEISRFPLLRIRQCKAMTPPGDHDEVRLDAGGMELVVEFLALSNGDESILVAVEY
jgi:hypothetical protein